mgnify:CR=1 FL=1
MFKALILMITAVYIIFIGYYRKIKFQFGTEENLIKGTITEINKVYIPLPLVSRICILVVKIEENGKSKIVTTRILGNTYLTRNEQIKLCKYENGKYENEYSLKKMEVTFKSVTIAVPIAIIISVVLKIILDIRISMIGWISNKNNT